MSPHHKLCTVIIHQFSDILTVFQYASAKKEKSTRVYVWGLAGHGALGEREFLKPQKPGKRPVEYMHRPYRLGFAEEHDVTLFSYNKLMLTVIGNVAFLIQVTNVACGYGFTVISVKGNKNSPQVFGTGLNTDSQIGS